MRHSDLTQRLLKRLSIALNNNMLPIVRIANTLLSTEGVKNNSIV